MLLLLYTATTLCLSYYILLLLYTASISILILLYMAPTIHCSFHTLLLPCNHPAPLYTMYSMYSPYHTLLCATLCLPYTYPTKLCTNIFTYHGHILQYSVIPYNVPTIHHTYVQGDMWICGGPTDTWVCGCVCGFGWSSGHKEKPGSYRGWLGLVPAVTI